MEGERQYVEYVEGLRTTSFDRFRTEFAKNKKKMQKEITRKLKNILRSSNCDIDAIDNRLKFYLSKIYKAESEFDEAREVFRSADTDPLLQMVLKEQSAVLKTQ